MSEQLAAIAAAAEAGASPETLVEQLEALHKSVLEDPQARTEFEREVLSVAGGIYLPHIFWIYLSAFLSDPDAYRAFLEYILQVYAQQPLNPFIDKRMQPLLYVYFSEEAPFYLSRLWDTLRRSALPEKYDFLQRVQQKMTRIPKTVKIFRDKFELIGEYLPNFEALAMPLPELRASLASQG